LLLEPKLDQMEKNEDLTKLKATGTLLFDQVPLWEEPGGFRLVQSAAIVRHVARAHGLSGKDEHEASICDSFHEFTSDMRAAYRAIAQQSDSVKKEEVKKNFLTADLPKFCAKLESILQKNGTGFLVGSAITYADLVVWTYFDTVLSDPSLFDISKYEHLSKFKASIEARPNIAKYRASPERYPVQSLFPRYVLHCTPNPNAYKTLIAALYGGLKVDFPQPFKMGVDNKTPEYLKKNPNGQIPTLDGPDGPIWESNAIAKYVTRKGNDKGLYGANEYENSLVDQWVEFYRSQAEPEGAQWLYPILGYREFNQQKYEDAKKKIHNALDILNKHLDGGREWIVGNRVTLADIIFFCGASSLLQHALEPEFLKPFPNFVAWVHRCLSQAHFKTYFGEFVLCTKEKQPGEMKRN